MMSWIKIPSVFITVTLVGSLSLSAPAIRYQCSGIDTYYQVPVKFDVVYSDWVLGEGYTYQAVEFSNYDNKICNQTVDLTETNLPGCTPRQSVNRLTLNSKDDTSISVSFQRGCDAEIEFDIIGTCSEKF